MWEDRPLKELRTPLSEEREGNFGLSWTNWKLIKELLGTNILKEAAVVADGE
jgi:hypothetical protein